MLLLSSCVFHCDCCGCFCWPGGVSGVIVCYLCNPCPCTGLLPVFASPFSPVPPALAPFPPASPAAHVVTAAALAVPPCSVVVFMLAHKLASCRGLFGSKYIMNTTCAIRVCNARRWASLKHTPKYGILCDKHTHARLPSPAVKSITAATRLAPGEIFGNAKKISRPT